MTSSSRIQLYLLVASFMMVIAGFFVLRALGWRATGLDLHSGAYRGRQAGAGRDQAAPDQEVSPEPPHEFVPPHPDRS